MERVKVYLDEARNAFVVCGNCGKSKKMSFSGREAPHASLVKCICGNTFIVTFEKRQYYRKLLDTFGTCYVGADSTVGVPVRVLDISLGGVQLQNVECAALQPNQKLRVVFRVNEKLVDLLVSVRYIRNDIIGAEIIGIDENSKKILGFYLMP